MTDINLKALGLEKRWPKLRRLQDEVQSLQRRAQEAEAEVVTLQAQLEDARSKDIDAASVAIRRGLEAPDATHEPKVQKRYESAIRNRVVLRRALESAREDLGVFTRKHQAAIYADILEARAKMAAKVAEGARQALTYYAQWSDVHYVLKQLGPPPAPRDENAPVQKLTQSVHGVQTTRRQGGLDRGHIEAALQYLISLAANEEGKSDAA